MGDLMIQFLHYAHNVQLRAGPHYNCSTQYSIILNARY